MKPSSNMAPQKCLHFSTKREPYVQRIQDSMFRSYRIHCQCSYLSNVLAPLAPCRGISVSLTLLRLGQAC